MHGTFDRLKKPTLDDAGEGWEPYIPAPWRRKEVIRQLGHKPTVYVMRKRIGWSKYLYRTCTPEEFSEIEKKDGG